MSRKWSWLLLVVLSGPLWAEDAASGIERNIDSSGDEDGRDGGKSGINNGCIINTAIQQVNFISNISGIIELVSGKKVLVTLRQNCSGIRNEGYVHKPINNKFCEGDTLRVIHYGTACIVDKIEPYVASAENQHD